MKLKPVTLVSTKYNKLTPGMRQQAALLNTLKVTQDPNKLKQIIGVEKAAHVFRTLNKIVMRKEYHDALLDSDVNFNFIVKGIKRECLKGEKSADRLKGYQILLRSLGMDSYDDSRGEGGGNWEDALQKIVKEKETTKSIAAPADVQGQDYEVIQPKLPDSVKARKKEELLDNSKSLYE